MRSRNQIMMRQMEEFVDDYYMTHHTTPKLQEIADNFHTVKSTVSRYLTEMAERGMIEYKDGVVSTSKTRKFDTEVMNIGIVGSVSCGIPMLQEEYVEEYVTLPVSLFGKGEFYIVRANGNSMIGAGIDNGDLVLIRKQQEANEGQIVVALVENENTLKRFFIDKECGCVRLHPENPDMKDILVKSCQIQGVAVHVIKSLQ